LETPVIPNTKEIKEDIRNMGADDVSVVHRGHSIYVAFKRDDGRCGRIRAQVCNYLARRFKDLRIIVLESPIVNCWCYKARVREPGTERFVSQKFWAREVILDF
jgi:hypothetical protein